MRRPQTYRPWLPHEVNLAVTMARAGKTCAEIAPLVGRKATAVNAYLAERHGGWLRLYTEGQMATVRPVAQYAAPDGPPLAEVFAPEASAEESEDAFLARVMGSATKSVEKARAQRLARLKIASREPIALTISSDWHVSPRGTDLAGLMRYAEYVAATPRLYAIAAGDLLDNPIKHKGANVSQIADDLRMLDILVGRFEGKLLGMTSGNHDDFSLPIAGTDHLLALSKRHRIHYAPDELLWEVQIVDPDDADHVTASYFIATRHQWRRNSNLNPCHACWTWWQEEGLNWPVHPDVLAIGHNHSAAVESRQFEARDVWALRMGAWQIDSSYARAKGFARYRPTAPTVVLPPTRTARVVAFSDPDAAVRYMTSPYAEEAA
jgi:hypothetical protein